MRLFSFGLLTAIALSACTHASDSKDDDNDAADVASVADALNDDEGGANLPPGAMTAAAGAPVTQCAKQVVPARELMITALGTVEDPVRTTWTGSLTNPADGAWTFGRLMTNMAGSHDPVHFVERWLGRWDEDRIVNQFDVKARPAMKSLVADAWPKSKDGHIDLTKAPLRLLAISNRLDLQNLDKGQAGEGRFVFGVLDKQGNPLEFTVILEFRLPGKTHADLKAWADLWHTTHGLKEGTAAFNTALQAVTDKFSGKNAAPDRTNGSAINQIRSNEIALDSEWELREFRLSSASGQLFSATVKQTPDLSFADSPVLGAWINTHQDDILAGTHWVTTTTGGRAFRAGSALTPFDWFWNPPGVKDPEARHDFSLNTCNGCHAGETGTAFLHVSPRGKGQVAQLSGFLTGETVADPVSGAPRQFNDLDRRRIAMNTILCNP